MVKSSCGLVDSRTAVYSLVSVGSRNCSILSGIWPAGSRTEVCGLLADLLMAEQ